LVPCLGCLLRPLLLVDLCSSLSLGLGLSLLNLLGMCLALKVLLERGLSSLTLSHSRVLWLALLRILTYKAGHLSSVRIVACRYDFGTRVLNTERTNLLICYGVEIEFRV
jgi:hypothetical protein